MNNTYVEWLASHLQGAKARYEELSRLDDQEIEMGGNSAYYEQAHQMFGYVAALEKCLREARKEPAGPETEKAEVPRNGVLKVSRTSKKQSKSK